MATLKYSRQREAIKDFLMTRKDHPTADVVYENIKKTSVWELYIATFLSYLRSERFRSCPILEVLTILMDALLHTATSCVRNADRFLIWKPRI